MGKPPNSKSADVPTMDEFNALTQRVVALESKTSSLESQVTGLDGEVDTLVTITQDLDSRVTALESGSITPPDPGPDPEPTGRMPLKITVAYNDMAVYFNEEDGVEFATYKDPKGEFEQRCIQVLNDMIPTMVMHIRPDVDGHREEVVIENTSLTHGANPGVLFDYTITIDQDGTTLHQETVAQHYGYSRWRWVSSDRPVRAEIADLIASGLLLNYKESLATNTPHSGVYTYTTMGLAGITGAMTGTGERPDIGPMTEYQADYVCNGSNLATVMAQGEACGTLPMHWRDIKTGAWADVFATYPHASQYNNSAANPLWPTDWRLNPDNGDRIATIQLDTAHFPAVAYLPWLLTGDPYYLEELHAQVLFDIISQPGDGRQYNIWFAIRAHAWALRSVMQAAKTTPDDVPNWILPKSFFVNYMNSNRDWLMRDYVNNFAPQYSVFATTEKAFGDNDESPQAPQGTYSQTYMEEFELAIFTWAVRMGFTDWQPIAEWKAKNTIGRTNGTSGWIRAYCTPYRQLLKPTKAAPFFSNWLDSWNLTQQRYGFSYTDPNQLPSSGNDMSYPSYTEGALATARSIGIEAAAPCHDWIHSEVDRLISMSPQRFRFRKWCIAP